MKIIFPLELEKLILDHISPRLHSLYFKVINEMFYRSSSCGDHWQYFMFGTKNASFSPVKDEKGKQHNASSVVKFLIEQNILSRDEHAPTPENIQYYQELGKPIPDSIPHFEVGKTTIKYRFNELTLENLVIKEVKTLKKDIKKMSNRKIKTEEEIRIQSIKNLEHFTCDMDELEKIIYNLEKPNARGVSRALGSCQQLNYDGYYGSQGETVSRIFNNMTTIPRWSRPSIRIDGERIAEVDFSCFQPTILASLCDVNFREYFKDIIDEYVHDVEWPELSKETVYMIFEFDFYNILAKQQGVSRDTIKYGCPETGGMTKYMFGPAHRKNNCFQRGLIAKCPEIHVLSKQIKSKACSKVIQKQRGTGQSIYYCSMVRILQNIEAYIMFDVLGSVLVQENIVFSTIHDSFVVKVSDVQKVKQCVQDKLKQEGLCPFGYDLRIDSKVYKNDRV